MNPKLVAALMQAHVVAPNASDPNATTVQYIFTADLWESAEDKLKSHDRQFWAPLDFDSSKSPPTIMPLQWIDSFELSLQ